MVVASSAGWKPVTSLVPATNDWMTVASSTTAAKISWAAPGGLFSTAVSSPHPVPTADRAITT
jgi:hypothetical protein